MEKRIHRTFELLDFGASKYGDKPAYYAKINSKWQALSYNQLRDNASQLSRGLFQLGVNLSENIATIFSINLPEWNILDMAITMVGAVNVPVYPTISDSDYLYILAQAEVRFVFVSDQILYNKIVRLQKELPLIQKIYSVEKLPNVDHWSELVMLGHFPSKDFLNAFNIRKDSIKPSDIATIVYTSGTTGFPKGVMLSHSNLVSNMHVAAAKQPIGEGGKVLSFLPLCHIYERTGNYQFYFKGAEIYYCENLKTVMENFREIKPDATTVVPRVLEKIVKGFLAEAERSPFLIGLLIKWAVRFGFNYNPHKKRKGLYRLFHKLADVSVYHRVRLLLGGRLSYVGCGGASVNRRVERFFWAAGIPVYQGYGLTECSPLVALNSPGENNFRIGTVGHVIEGMEVKIADDGEIVCKGENVMVGYYKQEELTRETVKDGWLYTGDLGNFVKNKFLRITGRKKQMFKTSYGKYIVPQAIESRFSESTLIEYIVVIGEGKHCAAAIIAPNFGNLRAGLMPGNSYVSNKELIGIKGIVDKIKKEVNRVNIDLGKTEQIKKFIIVPDEWSVETGELSPTFKIRRGIIQNKYKTQIFDLFKAESIV